VAELAAAAAAAAAAEAAATTAAAAADQTAALVAAATAVERCWLPVAKPHHHIVSLEPMKLILKAPGTKRLRLKYDQLLSKFIYNFNLRRDNLSWLQVRL
jgi:hypothetical protein